ncbi:metal-dependent amidase/aminoacylase/carboxypeptidase [Polyplosphaeria fusca]|uniref:Metal-dependent amidase/aminoacylase/carboxypeptidase n=1 Tax=Polyplosphaeria fusca TaxID=682080 RepID=A0A9P4QGB3_9PLEO|nr:metal-dependent amidase/aminoacylase/carboxypeptidase [Polyplosphaeria fusca]
MASSENKACSIVDHYGPDLEPFEDHYRDFHQNPELGTQEERTSAIAASHLQEAGYEVITHIGGFGVVGVLKNGHGPTVLLRADMDALPIREQTGLPYASTLEAVDTDGDRKPVMHACGHDSHVASMMGTSTLLAHAKGKWNGTLIILFQPDEEHGAGARAMLDDDLYDKIPKPDIVLGQHLTPDKAGVVLIRPGSFMAAADTIKVTVFGRGAHGAQPQDSIDPIVLAAHMIVRLQTVVSREIGPQDVASVTCAYIHGGKAHNVIPNEVEFMLNIRSFDAAVRESVLKAVKRIIRGEAIASGVTKEPEIESVLTFPPTHNDEEATLKLKESFLSYFGRDRTWEAPRHTASEDFSLLATELGVPSVFWNFGGVDHKKWREYERTKDKTLISSAHQADYAPVVQPTLKTAIEAMSLAALTFLK